MIEDPQFEAWLEDSFAQIQKGKCPDALTFSRYLSGKLPAVRHGEVAGHIAFCGYCDLAVESIRCFEPASRRIRRAPWWMLAAAAFVIGAALAYPAYRTLGSRPRILAAPATEVAEAVPRIQWAQMLQLDTTRTSSAEVAATGPGGALTLSFFVPIEVGGRYSATISDRRMRQVAGPTEITSYDAKGNFLVVCDRKNLPAGDYLLTVKEAGNPKREFHFAFTL